MKLLEQDIFLSRAKDGIINNVSLVTPFKFANGYFISGKTGEGHEVYATIGEDNKNQLTKLLGDTQ